MNTLTDYMTFVIDFARCVTRKEVQLSKHLMSYPPEHIELPDTGYLFGLETLLHAFENIYKMNNVDKS